MVRKDVFACLQYRKLSVEPYFVFLAVSTVEQLLNYCPGIWGNLAHVLAHAQAHRIGRSICLWLHLTQAEHFEHSYMHVNPPPFAAGTKHLCLEIIEASGTRRGQIIVQKSWKKKRTNNVKAILVIMENHFTEVWTVCLFSFQPIWRMAGTSSFNIARGWSPGAKRRSILTTVETSVTRMTR